MLLTVSSPIQRKGEKKEKKKKERAPSDKLLGQEFSPPHTGNGYSLCCARAGGKGGIFAPP